MTFIYFYKKSDSSRHEGVIDAASRDEAFAILRQQGVRPIKVIAKPSKKNNLWLVVTRSVISVLLAVACLMGVTWLFGGRDEVAMPMTRHVIETGMLTREIIEKAFRDKGERFLVQYAQPGGDGVSNIVVSDELMGILVEGMYRPCVIENDDRVEIRELKRIVTGMKEDMLRFIKLGCSVRDYLEMLETRRKSERQYFERIKNDFENRSKGLSPTERGNLRRRLNDTLRGLGLRPLPIEDISPSKAKNSDNALR